jgi:hypothetical protein
MAEGYGSGWISDETAVASAAGDTAILGIPRASADAGGMALGTGTGQQGNVPVASNDNGGFLDSIFDWFTQPLVGNVSAVGVFKLVGAVFFAIILWNLILYHIRIAGEEIL